MNCFKRGLLYFMKRKISIYFLLIIFLVLALYLINKNDKAEPDLTSNKPADIVETAIDREREDTGVQPSEQVTAEKPEDSYYINEGGETVQERIIVPEGFERVPVPEGSFGEYLRSFKLKPHGSDVFYYNGEVKPRKVHEAVLDLDVGKRDLQQCADSIIRLRAEYLYGKGLYDKIHFNFTNGFNADFSKWMSGYGIKVSGNDASWVRNTANTKNYESFRKYLDLVFAYAGTLSLSLEMESIDLSEIKPGDVFMYGSAPGHCAIVMDVAENAETGEKIFILAQGYMPAQDMHILKNPANNEGNPWYSLDFGERLVTPEWTFYKDQLMRFND